MHIEKISGPEGIKALSVEDLKALADELRSLIIERVSLNGGHLASNLGVVELAIALHYVFNSPRDKIIWDVGHQSYPHKLLTGRFSEFHTLRKYGGISGFPRRMENVHDAFGTGHSSTSISAALGIALARDIQGEDFKVVAVIGDGALTAGIAFEGLNQAGHLKRDLIVILNDNEMSISPNVGALSNYLNMILTGEFYEKFKRDTKALLDVIPKIGGPFAKIAQRAEESIKGFLLPGRLFMDLGFEYVGPLDGHDIPLLIETLRRVQARRGPILVHMVTKKGKGYKFSEEDPCIFHGIGPFKVSTGVPSPPSVTVPAQASNRECMSYSDAFGGALTELAASDSRIVAITAAMKEGTGLASFAEQFPGRFFDVGIAEQHAVTFAAGLAAQGLRPVVAVYSTFLQRAYDEVVHDVCLQKLPVLFAVDRAGMVGEDGATHQGLFDLSYLRHVPNLIVMAPAGAREFRQMLSLALQHDGPSAIRYPRGVVDTERESVLPEDEVKYGRSAVIRDGRDVAILAVGASVLPAVDAAERLAKEGVDACVVNVRFVKPLDTTLLASLAQRVRRFVTVEENVLAGGFGSAVLEFLNTLGLNDVTVRCIGIGDEFVEHGSQSTLRKKYGIDSDGIARAVVDLPEVAQHAVRGRRLP
ncbi:MAG: 1-deoxy-D-xylulose-5-phosphate synthase [Chloroflexota bacterium]